MNRTWRRTPLVGAFALATLAWALRYLTIGDPVLGSGAPQDILLLVAVASSVVLAILVAGTAILEIGASVSSGRATGLQRALVYALLTFAATFAGLRYLGFNLNTVLTTSAIVTAVVGFAMQATLSSVIAGLSLYADHALRVGDSVMHEGEPIEIISLNWRVAVGRRVSGQTIVIPNAKVADTACEILRQDEPHRAEFGFRAPLDRPPQILCDLAREAVADLPLVDRERPIAVAPVDFDPYPGVMRVRVQYWTRRYRDRSVVEGEAMRRIWYAMQRHGVYFPRFADLDERLFAHEGVSQAIAGWLARDRQPDTSAERVAALASKARLLFYAPDERITLPSWTEGWRLMILRGEARRTSPFELAAEFDETALSVERLGPTAAIASLADALSLHVGPYAKYAVARAGRASQDYADICRRVAQEIENPLDRERFLRKVLPRQAETFGSGTVLGIRRNATGALAAEPALRANGELVVLALRDVLEMPEEPQGPAEKTVAM